MKNRRQDYTTQWNTELFLQSNRLRKGDEDSTKKMGGNCSKLLKSNFMSLEK